MTEIFGTNFQFSVLSLETIQAPVWVNANLDATSDVSHGVSSLTDVGTGQIGVSFTRPFNSTSYVAIGVKQLDTGGQAVNQTESNLAVDRTDFQSTDSTALADPTEWNIIVLGNLA